MDKKKSCDNNMKQENQIFYDEFNIEKCKILFCLEDDVLLKYTNHTEYKEEENKTYIKKIKNALKELILNESNTIQREYKKSGCNRIYCKSSGGLQYFSNNILQFILPENSCEYDLKNSLPKIFLYLFKKHDLPYKNLEYYCNNRDDLLKKDNLKKLDILTYINKDIITKTNITWLNDLIEEVITNKPNLYTEEIDKISQDYKKEKKGKKNSLSSMCCAICFYYENEILQKAITKYKCIVPKFDGFLSDELIDIQELNELSQEYDLKWDTKKFTNIIKEKSYDENKLNDLLYPRLIYPHSFNTSLQLAKTIKKEMIKEAVYCNDKWYIYNNELWIKVKNPHFTVCNFIDKELDKTLSDKLKEDDVDFKEQTQLFNKLKQQLDKSAFMSALIKKLETELLDNDFTKKFDDTEFKFVFKDGIYDLKTKKFRKGIEKEEYITKTLPFDYNPNIDNEKRKWILDELLKICNKNQEHLEYYLSILSYCLCGVPHLEQKIFCLIGQGASNGKTIAIEALMEIFSIYIKKGETKIFESDCNKKHKFLIDFITKPNRLVICNEFNDKKEVDAKTFKEIADGETISNEILFGYSDDYKVCAKPIIIGNYTLKFDKTDAGIERRYKHLQFNSKFCDLDELKKDEPENLRFMKDNTFKKKLIDRKDEFIDIIIEYANKYFINNKLPDIPQEFKEEQDDVLNANNDFMNWFVDLDKNFGENEYCSSITLFNQYNAFATENNLDKLLKNRNLIDKMKQYNYKYCKDKMLEKRKGAFKGFSLKEEKKQEEKQEEKLEECKISDSESDNHEDMINDSDSD